MNVENAVVTILKNIGVLLQDDYMDIDLYESGLIDSLQLMQLITIIEERIDIAIDITEITPDIFKSVRTITEFVQRKLVQ